MKKDALVQVIADMGHTKEEATKILNGVLDTIVTALRTEDEVHITKFGTFKAKEVEERNGINPKTKEAIKIAPRRKISFSFAKKIKETFVK